MREIFVESEYPEFKCPPGFFAGEGGVSLGEPLQGGRSRAKPLYMHRLLAPEELTQAALFVYRHWKGRRCYPDPNDPRSPLWWVNDGEPERFLVVGGERRKARLEQIPVIPSSVSLVALERGEPVEAETLPGEPVLELLRLPECASVTVPIVDLQPQAPVPDPASGPEPRGEIKVADPFKRSLEAALFELTVPIAPNPVREERVAVRVVASGGENDDDCAVPLPSRPELVSSDFLALAEVCRPALTPIRDRASRSRTRFPNRAFVFAGGVLVLFLGLAFCLIHGRL